MIPHLSERALILAPRGRDAQVAASIFAEAGLRTAVCESLESLVAAIDAGAGFALVTEESLRSGDLYALSSWLAKQPKWSDFPFILLTEHGGGIERNPAAGRWLALLGNATFLERPFHPTTLISLAQSALRGRRRQYEARERLAALHDSEQRFRAAIRAVQGVLWTNDAEGRMQGEQPGWSALTGQSPEQYLGEGWSQALHPDDVGPVLAEWHRAVAERRMFVSEQRLRRADGQWRIFSVRAIPTYDNKGTLHEWVGVHTDVTEQRATERSLRELTETLEQRVAEEAAAREDAMAKLHEAQKLETIGQLTGGVAHDFNNLLMPIIGALDLLQSRHAQNDPRTGRLIDGALQSAERARVLVQRLLGFARRQSLETQATDMRALLDGMYDLIASSIGPTVELHTVYAPDMPHALVDPNQLELAILNLCVNARDAMPEGGVLTIATDVCTHQQADAALAPGKYLRISVSDTGVGMDAETLQRAIEPFFSTKETGRGTGLGLSMVHGLAAQLGGHFSMSSQPGVGTQAYLWLPIARDGALSPRRDVLDLGPVMAAPMRPLSVLLVDDEELVRNGTSAMLRAMGHQVTQAASGAEALEKLLAGLQVDVVVSDYKMPRMDGAELATRLRALRANLPVLLITGYSGSAEDTHGLPRLAKPFRQTDLAMALAELMDVPQLKAKAV